MALPNISYEIITKVIDTSVDAFDLLENEQNEPYIKEIFTTNKVTLKRKLQNQDKEIEDDKL